MDKNQFLDSVKLLPIYFLYIATFLQASSEKFLTKGVPDWFLKQFSPTILNAFPGALKLQYYALALAELSVAMLFAVSAFHLEFLPGSPHEFLKMALVLALFVFFALGFGLRMSGDFQGAANLFMYFGVTFLILSILVAAPRGAAEYRSQAADENAPIPPVMLNPNGGNVGIGPVYPRAMLEVKQSEEGIRAAQFSAKFTSDSTHGGGGILSLVNTDETASAKGGIVFSAYDTEGNSRPGAGIIMRKESEWVGGSWEYPASLAFFTRPADGSQAEGLRISPEGNVGIGITNPAQKLEVNGRVRASAFISTSDVGLKSNFGIIENPMEKILSIHGVTYDWKDPRNDSEHSRQMGLVAQQVEKVFPEAVVKDADGILAVNYMALVAPLVESVRAIYDRFTAGEKKLELLKSQVDRLAAENAALEARLKKLEQGR